MKKALERASFLCDWAVRGIFLYESAKISYYSVMKRVLLSFLFCFFTAGAAVAALNYDTCLNYYNRGDYKNSKACSARLLQTTNRADLQTRYLYAHSLLNLGEKGAAYAQFDTIRTISPNSKLGQESVKYMQQSQTIHKSSAAANKTDYGNYLSDITYNCKWGAMPVRVWIQPGSKYTETVVKAFNEWQYVSKNKIRFISTKSEAQGQILVYFKESMDFSNKNAVGYTTYPACSGKYFVGKSNIYLQTRVRGQIASQKEMYGVALHEIGHALGIMGHSKNNNDIMFPTTNIIGVHTSRRDVNTIMHIYSD